MSPAKEPSRRRTAATQPGDLAGLETQPASLEQRPRKKGLGLYWRTFWNLFSMVLAALVVWNLALHLSQSPQAGLRLDWSLATASAWAIATALVLAAIGSRMLYRPLRDLSFAASRVLGGDLANSRLDEDAATPEIRAANAGFNRMAEQLSQVDQDRAIMLAGISHDLRTPLARLRLETEISVTDGSARNHMVADIEQLDRTIDKFLDYARPEHMSNTMVCLNDVVDAATQSLHPDGGLNVINQLGEDIFVMADEVDLRRVLSNLFENARRYGKSPDNGMATVEVSAKVREHTVSLRVRDYGTGVSNHALTQLTKPFYRGDAARTAATGAGLGLAIVDKAVQRMGGSLALSNAPNGGLLVKVRLSRAAHRR